MASVGLGALQTSSNCRLGLKAILWGAGTIVVAYPTRIAGEAAGRTWPKIANRRLHNFAASDTLARRLLKCLAGRRFEISSVVSWFPHRTISLCFKPSLQAGRHRGQTAGAPSESLPSFSQHFRWLLPNPVEPPHGVLREEQSE